MVKAEKLTGRKRIDVRESEYYIRSTGGNSSGLHFLVVPMIYTVYFSGFKMSQIMRTQVR